MEALQKLTKAIIDFAVAPPHTPIAPFYKTALLNWIGCVVAGASAQPTEIAVGFHSADGVGSWLPPIGRSERLGIAATVLVDCLASAALAYDDIHFGTTLHPAGPVAAAIMGLARTQAISGEQALVALRLGMEVECRLSRAMMAPDTGSTSGWYPTGIAGGLGASAAVGWLLGFDYQRMEAALGLAAARASGNRGTHGAMSAFWVPGIAAEAGYVAARLAERNFSAGIEALSGSMGLIRLIAPQPAVEIAIDGLGHTFQSEATACKPYPLGFISFALIDCCLELQKQVQDAGEITSVQIEVSPTAARLGANPMPRSQFEAQISLRYIAGSTLHDPASVKRPVNDTFSVEAPVAKLMEQITILPAADLFDHQARASLLLRDGTKLQANCEAALGSAANLPGEESVKQKFLTLSEPVFGAKAAATAMQSIITIDQCADLRTVIGPLTLV